MSAKYPKFSDVVTDVDSCSGLLPGETHREDHNECPAGNDSRRRLYITRLEESPEILVGYCHNCQTSYCWRFFGDSSREGFRRIEERPATKDTIREYTLPPRLRREELPKHVKKYLLTRGILDDKDWDGLQSIYRYDPSRDAIVMAKYNFLWVTPAGIRTGFADKDYTPYGYHFRNFSNRIKYYKSESKDRDSNQHTVLLSNNPNPRQICVITEDMLSSYRIVKLFADSKEANVKSIVLYGTHLDPVELSEYDEREKPTEYVVWLDNDSDYNIQQGKQMSRLIEVVTGGRSCQTRHALVYRGTGSTISDPKMTNKHIIKSVVLDV